MTTENSTIQKSKYLIKKVYTSSRKRSWWAVFSNGSRMARFRTHDLALMYAIARVAEEHADDWMLKSTILDSRWIMFFINMNRQIVMPVRDKHYHSMTRREAKVWLESYPASYIVNRREEVYIYNEDLKRAITQTRMGEWSKYERNVSDGQDED